MKFTKRRFEMSEIPPEIEEKVLKEVMKDRYNFNNPDDMQIAMLVNAIQKGFKAGQIQTKNEVLKFAKDFFDKLYGRTNMGMFKKELSEEFERRLKAGVQNGKT